jgi:hypothetical protein
MRRHVMLIHVWVLGAPDPEMETIETLLRDAGEEVVYAIGADGNRVRPETAYQAVPVQTPHWSYVYYVECGVPGCYGLTIDHHRPVDPGYGRPPAEYLSASSLGQVLAELASRRAIGEDWLELRGWRTVSRPEPPSDIGRWSEGALAFGRDRQPAWWVPPADIRHVAAADHCLAAAYRGECPGVEPDALMRWRVESRARFQRRDTAALLADVERARTAIRSAPPLELAPGVPSVRDMRGRKVPELPEASARENTCVVADGLPLPDGRTKVVCQSGSPAQIRAFMDTWGPQHGLIDIYGDPARGFAGGYLLPTVERLCPECCGYGRLEGGWVCEECCGRGIGGCRAGRCRH